MRKLSAWCRSHPWLSSLGGLFALCAALHLFLNWRAEQRWQRYAAEARARGVKLTLPEFVRPEIPDAENFAALPTMRAAFAGQSVFALPVSSGPLPRFGNPMKGERIDWVTWQQYFQQAGFIAEASEDPVRDTLRALDHYAPQFQEWSQWRARAACRFPLDLEAGAAMPLPHLSSFMNAAKVFSLKVRAHHALGESAAAYTAFRDGLQAYHALRDDPALICGLVRTAVLTVVCASVGDGLRERAWAEPELRRLEADLAEVRLWEDYRLALSSERGFHNSVADVLAASSPALRGQTAAGFMAGAAALGTSTAQVPSTAFAVVPRSVYRDNQLRQNRYFDELLAGVNATATRLDPDRPLPSSPEQIANPIEQYYYFVNRVSATLYSEIEQRYLALQIQLDHSRLAVALERCRLARGAYPGGLAELEPEFCARVPGDVFSDDSYRYRRTAEGGFQLYSVGRNRRDDGGVPDPTKAEKKQADHIWLYAPRP